MKTSESIEAYFRACPNGRQRVEANPLHRELKKTGKTDHRTPRVRVTDWACSVGLTAEPEGGTEPDPDYYIFRKASDA